MTRYCLLLVVILLLEGTVRVDADPKCQLKAEQDLRLKYKSTGTDKVGGKSATAQHAAFTGYRPKSVEMGRAYRERLLTYLSQPVPYQGEGYVFTSTTECDVSARFRTADGSCNNLQNPDYGQSSIPMRRFLDPVYEDGISAARAKGVDGDPLESPRKISTTVHTRDPDSSTRSTENTHMIMQWGQFLDHDITLTPVQRGEEGAVIECCAEDLSPEAQADGLDITARPECLSITIPEGDRRFKRTCMNFVRSVQIENAKGQPVPTEQLNALTAFVDGSQIYGSTDEEQAELRTFERGLLATSQNDPELLPRNPVEDCVTFMEPNFCFRAGDERADEQPGLASMHTIWLREHNRIARTLSDLNPHWKDERIFQEARRIVGAELQHITFTEFLPIVLSDDDLVNHNLRPVEYDKYGSFYDHTVDPSIRNAFATAAYRFGHSMIRSIFGFRDQHFFRTESRRLRNLFSNTSVIISNNGDAVNTLTRGLLEDGVQLVDRHISPELTDNLFLDEDGHSLDLMSLNIQRGRDHGLPGYNAFREWCGLPKANNFGGDEGGLVNHPPDARKALDKVYRSTYDIDLFPGGISETPVEGGLLGPTFSCLVARQFELLKIGDRFFYESGDDVVRFTRSQLREIRKASLSGVICENTNTKSIQPEAFRQEGCRNVRVDCSNIPKIDLSRWEEWGPNVHGCGEK